jgi:hypothetical protein
VAQTHPRDEFASVAASGNSRRCAEACLLPRDVRHLATEEGAGMSVQNCPICGLGGTAYASGDATVYTCRRCGKFSLTGSAEAILANRKLDGRTVANASGWIREHQGIKLDSYELESLLQQRTPTVAERAMKLLQELAR